MEQYKNLCQSCGGSLLQIGEDQYRCEFCGTVFDGKAVMRYADELRKLLDELKIEAISNARRNLYEAVNAEYVSSKRVHECCVILKQLLPDDFQASFYEIATGNNVKQLTRAIRRINVEENMPYIDGIVRFLLRSFQTEYQLELNNLIAKAYEKTNPEKFEEYCTMLADEAVKVDNGVYETKLPREVFVAYSSKDMDAVSELTEALESQGLKCFVAARNLRHGKGAVENYNRALEEAMDHCRSIVFVSSVNSRSFNCDALTIELPYIQKKDTENAPAEYKNNYKAMPQQYKKPRVEYRIGESVQNNVADVISNEIFDGYERAYSPEEVAVRVIKQLVAAPAASTKKQEAKVVKYCVSCLAECPQAAKFCMECGGKEFAASREAAELKQQILALEKQKAELEKAKAAEEPKAALTVKPAQKIEVKAKEGLKFELNSDGNSYSVAGIGDCKDTEIVIPTTYNGKPVTAIEEKAFESCPHLKIITIPDSVTSIGDDAFSNCSSLTSVTIPDSVTSIGDDAFSNCSSLTSITIPDSVTSIGNRAFSGCSSLTSITIPDSVTSIGIAAFWECLSLTSISLPFVGESRDATSNKHFGYIFGARTCTNQVHTVPLSLKTVAITGGTNIGISAFENCKSLTGITLSDSIKSIGYAAFYNCSSLTSVTIGDSVTSIGYNAFSSCSSLTSITIPDSVISIGNSAFYDCDSLTSVTIPDSVTSIGGYAFYGCSSLTNITIPDSVTSIGESAFYNLESLDRIIFKNPVGWRKAGGGLFSKISPSTLSDPQKAAEALTTTYQSVALKRV